MAAGACASKTITSRALRLLPDEGLLEFRRGRGTRVASDAKPKSAVLAQAHERVGRARPEGYRKDELLRLIDNLA